MGSLLPILQGQQWVIMGSLLPIMYLGNLQMNIPHPDLATGLLQAEPLYPAGTVCRKRHAFICKLPRYVMGNKLLIMNPLLPIIDLVK